MCALDAPSLFIRSGMSICGGSVLAAGFISILRELHLDLTFSEMLT